MFGFGKKRESGEPGGRNGALIDLDGVTVMYDESHGQSASYYYSILVADLESRGAVVVPNQSAITSELLANVNIFWSSECYDNWTAS